MAKLNLKILKPFVQIIPEKQTYFTKKEIPDIQLNKETIRLNYNHLSPFKDGDIIFYKDKRSLYIWFTKNKIETRKICIPEGFLTYKEYSNQKDVIIIKKLKDNTAGITVIKNNVLTAQFFKNIITDDFIEILKKEYALKNPKIQKINGTEKSAIYINIEDIIKFANSVNISLQSILINIYEQLKVPTIVFLAFLNIFDFLIYQHITGILKDKNIELSRLETSNRAIKEKFSFLEQESNFFKKFIESEFKYPDLYSILSVITNSMAQNNAIITIYRQSYNAVDLWLVSKSVSLVVNSLINTGYFNDIQVISVSQFYEDKTKEVGHLELKIKARVYDR